MTTAAPHRRDAAKAAFADSPDPDALVARAAALVPALRERQEQAEAQRRVPAENIRLLKEAGLYRVLQPKRYGGLEHGLDTFVRVAAEVASGCGSTGWVFSTGAQHQWQLGMYAEAAQDEVWGDDPLALAASSYPPTGIAAPVDGGYRLSGRWSFCSGVEVADWMVIGVRIAESAESPPQGFGFALVPKADYAVIDTWNVFGLIGTGSHDLEIDDVFLPAHRLLTHEDALSGRAPGTAVNAGPLYRIPFFAAISMCLCSAILGMARGALAEYLDGMRERRTRGAAVGAARSVTEFQTLQLRVGEASASVDAAIQLVLRDAREIMAAMEAGEVLTEAQRARNKGDLGFAVRLCARATDLLFESVGGMGIYNHSRLQRFWRDLHAGAQHISMNWDAVGSLYGRVQLGVDAGPMQF
ncbi:MAG: flavin-dependent monooxygenase [Alphaproteobacteria bacterium]|nr:flavin-dependent monooxygenase [Alphaproteobacteria bacterium]